MIEMLATNPLLMIVTLAFGAAWAIMLFLLPIYVRQINNRLLKTNRLLEQIANKGA